MTPDFPTHVRRFGQGARQALAIHCTLGHAGSWRGVAAGLADRLMITAYDLPGHGKSVDWLGQGDLSALSVQMGVPFLQERVDLMGHSFGAAVALRLAAAYPDQVRSLSLIEPVFFAAARVDDPASFDTYTKNTAPFAEALAAQDMALAAQLFNRVWGDGRRWMDFPEGARRYMTERIHLIPEQSAFLLDDSTNLLAPQGLEALRMPVLLMEGEQSPQIIHAVHRALAARLPTARRVTIAEAGHMAPITHPTQVAAEIANLLEMTEE